MDHKSTCKSETMNLLEDNIGENHELSGILRHDIKIMIHKRRNANKLDFIETKSFCSE